MVKKEKAMFGEARIGELCDLDFFPDGQMFLIRVVTNKPLIFYNNLFKFNN